MSLLRKLLPRTYMARRNLLRARTRTILAILTVVIGVVAIAGLGTFGLAFQAAQLDAIGDVGNEVQVTAGDDLDRDLNRRELREIERIAGDAEIVPVRQRANETSLGEFPITVYGIQDPSEIYEPADGEFPDPYRRGAIVGQSLANNTELETGQRMDVGNDTYRIAAIAQDEGFYTIARPNFAIVVPIDHFGTEEYDEIYVRADDAVQATRIADEIRESLNGREQKVAVSDQSEQAQNIQETFWLINMFLLGVGGISLLVAGISIANVQLMSAMERREEIGVLRAVGYRRRDILGIMLVEAALMGAIAAAIGVVLSLLLGLGINELMLDDPLAYQPGTVNYLLGAFAFGVIVSVIAGLYPAWKASRKPPVEALRG